MSDRSSASFDRAAIRDLVRHLPAISVEEHRRLMRLTPAERVSDSLRRAAIEKSLVREALRQQYPDVSESELNMRTLASLTPVRMPGYDLEASAEWREIARAVLDAQKLRNEGNAA